MAGWYGYAEHGEAGPPPDPAYSRVTNPERFRPLHAAMLEAVATHKDQQLAFRPRPSGPVDDLAGSREAASLVKHANLGGVSAWTSRLKASSTVRREHA